MAHDRFVNETLSELEDVNRSPIYGYQQLPVLTLEEATEKIIPLVPGVVDYVSTAKQKCYRNSMLLTWEESAAIYLYSMPIPFFSRLNEVLRVEDRHALKPWFSFLKLFITALKKLPSTKATVWRGVNSDASSTFVGNHVHIWWSVISCSKALNVVEQYLGAIGTVFAIDAIHGKDISMFSTFPEEQEIVLMPGIRVHPKCQSLNFESRFFIVHLEEETSQSESQTESNYLFGHIKQEYQRHSRIARFMNPSRSFPIEQSYINLAIVETKEQQLKEKKLLGAKLNNEIIGTFEEIYGTKTNIEIKDIFQTCRDQTKNILIFGRAGIGKTTFCQYVTHQWATGKIWRQYDLVVLFHLRNLTESRYPPLGAGIRYSLVDLIKTEYFHHGLNEKNEKLLKEQLDVSLVLWLLDGYDEIVQNIPPHLRYLFEQLLWTPHHILTSRPYSNTLLYDVKLEIIGFTNENIKRYVEQFFDQTKDEINHALAEAQKLLSFLKCNPNIWGIVHIPVNLELICSLWCDTDCSKTVTMTMTTLYDKMTEWLCRRHLQKQNSSSNQMTKHDIYTNCHKELTFLESLAFNGMKSNDVLLRPKLLHIASKESECALHHQPSLLNIGILKSIDYKPIGTCIEADKNHYFVHLSFQEHFAARYVVRALNEGADQKQKALDFISAHKYNQRFELLFTFASGLLNDSDDQRRINLFWETLWEAPLDLIGLRHVQLLIACIEETDCNRNLPRFHESMNMVLKWTQYFIAAEHTNVYQPLQVALQKSPSLVNQPEILHTFLKLIQHADPTIKQCAYLFISALPISNPPLDLIRSCLTALTDDNQKIRSSACEVLAKMGEIATNEIINGLISALKDTDEDVRSSACEALGKMGEKAGISEIINRLVSALGDTDEDVRSSVCKALGTMAEKAPSNEIVVGLISALEATDANVRSKACYTLGKMGEKAATNDVIHRLASALHDVNADVRSGACYTLGKMGEKAATNDIIHRLIIAAGDKNGWVRASACHALGRIGEKVATNELVNRLVNTLGDTDKDVRSSACEALGMVGEKAATNEIINRLVSALENMTSKIRSGACEVLGKMAEKAATNEIINRLASALADTNAEVRSMACKALDNMGEKAATIEIINGLVSALKDTDEDVKSSACEALGKMGEKAATNEIINYLVSVLGDADGSVRASARYALGKIGENAASNTIINRLVSALENTNCHIRSGACEVLGKMSEKVATNEIINRIVSTLGDTDEDVRSNACLALGRMGKKAGNNQIINGLVIALRDADEDVRNSACEALGWMGEKAATNDTIHGLVSVLGDTDFWVRASACYALGKMGEKAATNEVIGILLDLDSNNEFLPPYVVTHSVEKILSLCPSLSELNDETVEKLSNHIANLYWYLWINISPEKLIRAYLDTEILFWLSIIKRVFINQGFGFALTKNTVMLYGGREPVELSFSSRECGQKVQDYFVDKTYASSEHVNELCTCVIV